MRLTFTTLSKIDKLDRMPSSGSHPGEVHVWVHTTDAGDPFEALANGMLSKDETDRSLKYHFERDRKVYLSGHVLIRKVLSHYTGLSPADIDLTPVVNAKPKITNAPFPIHFNISHCGSKILVAVGFDSDVGVDVEEINDDFDMEGFAENNYHANEIKVMTGLNGQRQVEYFYTVWTCKESWLKLTGEGNNERLRELDFSGQAESPKGVEWSHDIQMVSWKETENYLATVASALPPSAVRFINAELIN